MKREGAQQSRGPWSSSTLSAYPRLITDEQRSQPATAPGNSSGSSSCCLKCNRHRRCAPAPKSRGKVKGAGKVRSCDVALNHLLVSWRGVDRGVDGMVSAGVSASRIVGYLEGYPGERDDDDDYDGEMEQDGAVGASGYCGPEVEMGCEVGETGGGVDEEEPTVMGLEEDGDGCIELGETDDMGFCQVGFVCECVDEDWCVVEEL